METHTRLSEWLANMGFQGKIPHNLQRICNPSTAIIWEQLVNKTRPKQEVEYIRNNILIHRVLKNCNTSSVPHLSMLEDKSDYPIKEVVVWDKKQTLKQHIDSAKYRIEEHNSDLVGLNKQNKIKYINLQNIKNKIHEHHRFNFLLNSKVKELEADLSYSEKMLKQVRNSTPIETVEQNDDDILNTLKMCSEKLCQIIEQQKGFSMNSNVTIPFNKPENSFSTLYGKQGLDESLGLLDSSMSFTNAVAASSFISTLNFSNYNLAILNNADLNRALEDQLHNKDRRILWNAIHKFSETSKVELINAIADNDKINLGTTKTENKEERKLYALHVEYELKTRKTICEIEVLREELKYLFDILISKCPEYSQSQVKLHLKQIGLDAVSQQIQEFITKMHPTLNIKNDFRTANERASLLQENIESTMNSIKHKLATFKEALDAMFQTRNKISVLVRQLAPFTLDLNWTLALISCINSTEIQTFLDFPLEYNRTLIQDELGKNTCTISLNCIPHQEELDSNFIYMLLAILQNPAMPTEVMLADTLKAILKLNHLKDLRYLPQQYHASKYTIDDLQKQDKYLNYALDKLKTFKNSNSVNRTGATLLHLKNTINLWLEMPIKDFVSSKQVYNGKMFDYYEKLFEDYYNQL